MSERRRITRSDQLDYSKLLVIENGEPVVPVVCFEFGRKALDAVRMIGFANDKAIAKTLETGLATFWSRSQKGLWTKGLTSGNTIRVDDIFADCDNDTVLYIVRANGPTCHTGTETCFDVPGGEL